jgi:hypothetical protein
MTTLPHRRNLLYKIYKIIRSSQEPLALPFIFFNVCYIDTDTRLAF